ncbi:MAG: Na(+)/H(+) antiporter subunit B [Alphaproteobacteria bacterium]|nr:Na(+)/H(+) antiporter subunit B [Alphaproteobacteria bacterium]
MKHHVVLRVVAKLLIPYILLYAFYVQFHGDYGPGGGFQAGVIFASAFILHALVFGLESARKAAPSGAVRFGISLGVLLYAGTGVFGLLLGGNFLDYSVLSSTPTSGQHLGILIVEAGVGITVASVIIAIFFAFAGRRRRVE